MPSMLDHDTLCLQLPQLKIQDNDFTSKELSFELSGIVQAGGLA